MPSVWLPPAIANETIEILRGTAYPALCDPPDFFDGAISQQYGYLTCQNSPWIIKPNDLNSDYTVVRFNQTRNFPWPNRDYPDYVWTITNPSAGTQVKFALADGTYATTITAPSQSMGIRGFAASQNQTNHATITVSKTVTGVSQVLATGRILTQSVQVLRDNNQTWHNPFNNGFESNFTFSWKTNLGESPHCYVTTEVLTDVANIVTQNAGSTWSALIANDASGCLRGPANCSPNVWNLQFRAWNQPTCRNPIQRSTPFPQYGVTYPYNWLQKYPLFFYIVSSAGSHLMHLQTSLYLWVSEWFAYIGPTWLGDLSPTAGTNYSRSIDYRMLGD